VTAVLLILAVEDAPRYLVDSLSELETARLRLWLRDSSVLEELAYVLERLAEELREEPEEAA
jgi:hypothetical protein